MPLKNIKVRRPKGVLSHEAREGRKIFVHKIVAGRGPCEKCKSRQKKLIGVLCTSCSTNIGRWGHHAPSPAPKLYDLVPETELIQQIFRMNREVLQPAADFFDTLLDSAVAGTCPLDKRIAFILVKLKTVGGVGEDLFAAFTAPFANLYLGRKWPSTTGKLPLLRWIKDDENAKAVGGHLVLKFTSLSAKEKIEVTGGMRKELARYTLANIAPLVYNVARTCVETMNKRKALEAEQSGIVLSIPA